MEWNEREEEIVACYHMAGDVKLCAVLVRETNRDRSRGRSCAIES